MDDGPILQQFVDSRAQEAFAHLVSRHVHLVYSACLRQLKDPALADHAAQAVFLLLARNGPRLTTHASLVPWLFDTAYRVCRAAVRVGWAVTTMPLGINTPQGDWHKLAPHIDDAIASLPEDARYALLLKYVANLPLRDVANALNIVDSSSGRLISAGVARLRRYFEARNIQIAPDALVAALQAHAVQAAPPNAAYNATQIALGPANPPMPASAVADAVAGSLRREKVISLASMGCIVVLLGLGVFKLYGMVKSGQLAATQPVTQPVVVQPPPVTPSPPAPPDKPAPVSKPVKPVDPELARRFIAAIRQSDVDAIQQLFEQDENVINAKDPASGRSAVEIAADLVLWHRQDATRIAHFLIEAGAATDIHTSARAGHKTHVAWTLILHPQKLNATDAQGLTPLQRAALVPGSSPECEEVVDLLIQSGASVDLWTACTFGRLDDVRKALAEHPEQINRPCLGATPLNWALRPRRYADDPLAIPTLLLEKGADLRSRDTAQDGMTPLHHAGAWGGQVKVAEFLMDKGIDVNILDDYAWTPLDYAIDRGRKEMVEVLQAWGGRRTTVEYPDRPVKTSRFFAAVQSGDAELTHRLLDDTPELAKSRGTTGETPLHFAAAIGSIPIIDLLLADKADLNAQETNKYGGTPLHWAVRHDRLEAVRHLLAKGADPKLINQRSGQTVLHVAAQHTDNAALVELLLQSSDRAVKDRFGKTALDYAQEGAHTQVAAKLH